MSASIAFCHIYLKDPHSKGKALTTKMSECKKHSEVEEFNVTLGLAKEKVFPVTSIIQIRLTFPLKLKHFGGTTLSQ